jgi:hypothetical protein
MKNIYSKALGKPRITSQSSSSLSDLVYHHANCVWLPPEAVGLASAHIARLPVYTRGDNLMQRIVLKCMSSPSGWFREGRSS